MAVGSLEPEALVGCMRDLAAAEAAGHAAGLAATSQKLAQAVAAAGRMAVGLSPAHRRAGSSGPARAF